jgi:hypothetical protein
LKQLLGPLQQLPNFVVVYCDAERNLPVLDVHEARHRNLQEFEPKSDEASRVCLARRSTRVLEGDAGFVQVLKPCTVRHLAGFIDGILANCVGHLIPSGTARNLYPAGSNNHSDKQFNSVLHKRDREPIAEVIASPKLMGCLIGELANRDKLRSFYCHIWPPFGAKLRP